MGPRWWYGKDCVCESSCCRSVGCKVLLVNESVRCRWTVIYQKGKHRVAKLYIPYPPLPTSVKSVCLPFPGTTTVVPSGEAALGRLMARAVEAALGPSQRTARRRRMRRRRRRRRRLLEGGLGRGQRPAALCAILTTCRRPFRISRSTSRAGRSWCAICRWVRAWSLAPHVRIQSCPGYGLVSWCCVCNL